MFTRNDHTNRRIPAFRPFFIPPLIPSRNRPAQWLEPFPAVGFKHPGETGAALQPTAGRENTKEPPPGEHLASFGRSRPPVPLTPRPLRPVPAGVSVSNRAPFGVRNRTTAAPSTGRTARQHHRAGMGHESDGARLRRPWGWWVGTTGTLSGLNMAPIRFGLN